MYYSILHLHFTEIVVEQHIESQSNDHKRNSLSRCVFVISRMNDQYFYVNIIILPTDIGISSRALHGRIC